MWAMRKDTFVPRADDVWKASLAPFHSNNMVHCTALPLVCIAEHSKQHHGSTGKTTSRYGRYESGELEGSIPYPDVN